MKVSTLVAGLLLWPAAAGAQAPPGAELAGGAITRPVGFAGGADVGIRVSPQGDAVTIRAAGAVTCRRGHSAEGESSGTGPVAPDGSFSLTLVDEVQQGERGYKSSVVAVGRIAGDRATGTLEIRIRGPRTCRKSLPFTAVTVGDLAGAAPGPAPGGATLFGRILAPLAPSGPPFSFNLRTSADGKTVRRMVFGYHHKCTKWAESFEQTWYVPPAKVRADGSFRRSERGSITYTDSRETFTSVAEGRFVAGGATGTARVRSVVRSRRNGRILARCDSGAMTWSAIR